MRRREFLGVLGGAAVWPLAARAQQPTVPVIGFLGGQSSDAHAPHLVAIRQGLGEFGYVESRNFAFEYRFSDGQVDRLAALASDLVRRRVALIIAASGSQTALATKAATDTIPIVFLNGSDAVAIGLVGSINRPGGNVTGVSNFTVITAEKRLELMRELIPASTVLGWLQNPRNPNADALSKSLPAAAQILGREILLLNVSSQLELVGAFATLLQKGAGAVILSADPIFAVSRDQIIALAARHSLPTMYPYREHVMAGGLLSYGPDNFEMYRQVGAYAGRILKGDKPADLPVLLPTKLDLVINLKTPKTLGLNVPQSLLASADEVIE